MIEWFSLYTNFLQLLPLCITEYMSHHGNSATFAIPKSIKVYSFWNPYHYKKNDSAPSSSQASYGQNYNCGIFSQTWPPKSPDTSSAPNVWLEYKINTQDIFLLLLILLRKYLFKICSLPQKIQRTLISVF